MNSRAVSALPGAISGSSLVAVLCLCAVVAPVRADEPGGSEAQATQDLSPEAFATSLAVPDLGASGLDSPGISEALMGLGASDSTAGVTLPQGNEMSVIAGVELERNDRRFRSRVVSWARNQSLAAGLATDLLLRGSDTGVYLDVLSGSSYVVRWRTRF